MEPTKGLVVRALAGRDAGKQFVVLSVADQYVLLADGKRRKLEHPKRKNVRHIQLSDRVLSLENATNKQLRKELKEYE